jgi:superoxide reductase
MTQLNQVYRCEVCGNIVEVLHTGVGELVCCNKGMVLQVEHEEDQGFEKHLPSLSFEGDILRVTIGSTLHPMEAEHYIEWIEYIVNGQVCRKNLKPEDTPEAVFKLIDSPNYTVRAYCNIHGLWELKV